MCGFAYIQVRKYNENIDCEYVIFSRKEEPFGLTST